MNSTSEPVIKAPAEMEPKAKCGLCGKVFSLSDILGNKLPEHTRTGGEKCPNSETGEYYSC